MTRMLQGQCLCGAVRYTVAEGFLYAANCHCSQCRRATGSAFKPFAGSESAKLRITQGAEQTLRYGDEQGYDQHCGRCGSLLYSLVREGQYVHVTLGTLVDAPSIRPDKHIHVASKAPWYTITDDLPQYAEFP